MNSNNCTAVLQGCNIIKNSGASYGGGVFSRASPLTGHLGYNILLTVSDLVKSVEVCLSIDMD